MSITAYTVSKLSDRNYHIYIKQTPSANSPLQTSITKFDVALGTFKNMRKMSVLKERLEKTNMKKVGQKF